MGNFRLTSMTFWDFKPEDQPYGAFATEPTRTWVAEVPNPDAGDPVPVEREVLHRADGDTGHSVGAKRVRRVDPVSFLQSIDCGALVYGARDFLVIWKSYVVMPYDQYPKGARCFCSEKTVID